MYKQFSLTKERSINIQQQQKKNKQSPLEDSYNHEKNERIFACLWH